MSGVNPNEWVKLPGLFHRWELDEFIDPDWDLYFEKAGQDDRGLSLYVVYHRPHQSDEEKEQ